MTTKSIKGLAHRAMREDKRARADVAKSADLTPSGKKLTSDSFQNFVGALGMGTDNLLSASTYGFNPISRIRTLCEWIHRGSWLGGVAIDVVADDMTRMGVEIKGDLEPGDIEELQENFQGFGNWAAINDNIKWARLYGGSIAVMLIDGQKMDTPLRLETIGKDQYKGLLVLDRWMCDPSLGNLVTELGPNLGMPKFYRVTSEAPALVAQNIHYTRVLRMEGIRLPYWQRVMENLWGISVIERLYDRMVSFDSATAGASQLAYKSYLRTYGVENLREIISSGGKSMDALVRQIQFMRATQSNEGITLMDTKDTFEAIANAPFTGINELLAQLGQQLSGALQIPLVRLFGQSPAGFSTGETDLRAYYDTINQKQNREMKGPVTSMYRAQAQSMGLKLPPGFGIVFRPLWQLTEEQKATVATGTTDAIMKASDAGLISDQVALKELKQQSTVTGVFTNIQKADIDAASDIPVPKISENPGEPGSGEGEGEGAGGEKEKAGPGGKTGKEKRGPGDSAIVKKKVNDHDLQGRMKWNGLDVAIENRAGSARRGADHGGKAFSVRMSHDYGYIENTVGADGEAIDCFIGPDRAAEFVYVAHTLKAPSFTEYDEDKCFLDFSSAAHAKSAFAMSYDDIRHLASIASFPVPDFIRFVRTMRPGAITRDEEKSTKQNADYTPHAKNRDERCDACIHFRPDSIIGASCEVVLGAIEPIGWCKYFSRK